MNNLSKTPVGAQSNSAAELDHLATVARERYAGSVTAWMEAASVVAEARKLASHGQWLPWLEKAGIAVRTANRMVAIIDAGYDSGHVAKIGVAEAALRAANPEAVSVFEKHYPFFRDIVTEHPDMDGAAMAERTIDLIEGDADLAPADRRERLLFCLAMAGSKADHADEERTLRRYVWHWSAVNRRQPPVGTA